MAPLAFQESRLSPLEEPIVRGHMEVWSILKDHIEMTVEMKLEQLYQMIVSSEYQNREQPHTEFRELLSSLPVESVTGFECFKLFFVRESYCFPSSSNVKHINVQETNSMELAKLLYVLHWGLDFLFAHLGFTSVVALIWSPPAKIRWNLFG